MKWNTKKSVTLAGLLALLLVPSTAQANRPFLTDDGAIAEVGEMEVQFWTELVPGNGDGWAVAPLGNLELSTTVTRGVEFTLGGGVGFDADGEMTVINPMLELKTLWLSADGGRPGVAWSVGVHAPFGTGSGASPATTVYTMVPLTFEAEEVALHLNLGWVMGWEEGFQTGNLLAGAGLEWAFGGGPLAGIAEVFAGDDGDAAAGFEPLGQLGLRFEATDALTLDAGVISSFEGDWMVQAGLVWVLELFGRET